jgi:diadenosine tetraphosphate (Ap4A) HIT family hydrolase
MTQIENTTSNSQSAVSRCEFCTELSTPEFSRFFRIYGSKHRHRIVARQGPFVAMPTIGQVFPGTILVMPVEHWERFSDLPDSMLMRLCPFLDQLGQSIAAAFERPQPVVMFEHGARSRSLGGCGIYHAHIHIVPVPDTVDWCKILPDGRETTGFESAIRQLRETQEYLLFRDTAGRVAVAGTGSVAYGSQYFRRVLAQHFGVSTPWDWRAYTESEPSLIETIRHFGDVDAP